VLSPELIEGLRQRIVDPAHAVDLRFASDHRVAPPVDAHELASAEDGLGFRLPDELRDVYLNVANGGFGPGYGLLGVASGTTDDLGNTADSLYKLFAQADPDDPSWRWPSQVVPFSYWGCAVYSCITPEGMVIGFDEGQWADDEVSLDAWLRAWLKGSLNQPTGSV
jgi:SMI1/KNR4 family protein SUKH-1